MPGRRGIDQATGIGMARLLQHRLHRSALDDASGIHDADLVGQAGHQRQVVTDPDQRAALLAAQRLHLLHDLALGGHVQRSGGLIGNQQGRLVQQRNGDGHTLAHAARELMRILTQSLLRVVQPELRQRGCGTRQGLLARQRVMRLDGLDHLGIDA